MYKPVYLSWTAFYQTFQCYYSECLASYSNHQFTNVAVQINTMIAWNMMILYTNICKLMIALTSMKLSSVTLKISLRLSQLF